jgi:hypothetical protein
MTGKRKFEPSLKLDLGFDEALSRFVATEPKEVVESIERSKTKKPPEDTSPRPQKRVKRRALKRL